MISLLIVSPNQLLNTVALINFSTDIDINNLLANPVFIVLKRLLENSMVFFLGECQVCSWVERASLLLKRILVLPFLGLVVALWRKLLVQVVLNVVVEGSTGVVLVLSSVSGLRFELSEVQSLI